MTVKDVKDFIITYNKIDTGKEVEDE